MVDGSSYSITDIFVDPENDDFLLKGTSGSNPAIDGGNSDASYNDPEDPEDPGNAQEPAKGTITNDMGAYGGPKALEKVGPQIFPDDPATDLNENIIGNYGTIGPQ
jgi:hypothetical protein